MLIEIQEKHYVNRPHGHCHRIPPEARPRHPYQGAGFQPGRSPAGAGPDAEWSRPWTWASMNHLLLRCIARRASILATGDELVAPGKSLGPARSSIQRLSGHDLGAAGASRRRRSRHRARIASRSTVAAIRKARDANAYVLVTLGGASVGDYDLVQKALAAERIETPFWKIAMRPGTPRLCTGGSGKCMCLGLPEILSLGVCLSLLFLAAASAQSLPEGPIPSPHRARPLRLGICRKTTSWADYLRVRTSRTGYAAALVATPSPVQDFVVDTGAGGADRLILREPFAAK